MRIAHIILAHKNPEQLARLIKRLSHRSSDFYIHLDKKVDIDDFRYLEKLENVSFIKNRVKCNWGGNTLSIGILTSMEEILNSGIAYDFINLVSGQDYPIVSANEFYNYFRDKKGYNFISYDDDKNSQWWKQAKQRYERYHFTDFNFTAKYFFERIFNFVAPKRKFPSQLEVFGGSKATWWIISRACAEDIIATLAQNNTLNNFLKYCWGTDELVIPTLILNSKHKSKTINNNFRYIDWSEGNAHPKMLSAADYENIITSDNFLARKLDLEFDRVIFDKLDKLIES